MNVRKVLCQTVDEAILGKVLWSGLSHFWPWKTMQVWDQISSNGVLGLKRHTSLWLQQLWVSAGSQISVVLTSIASLRPAWYTWEHVSENMLKRLRAWWLSIQNGGQPGLQNKFKVGLRESETQERDLVIVANFMKFIMFVKHYVLGTGLGLYHVL